MFGQQRNLIALLALALSANCVLAKPYYFFHDAAPQAQVSDALQGAGQQIANQAQSLDHQHRGNLHGHLNDLYSKTGTAVKSLAENVQPDIKNIGQDLTDAFHATRDNVNKRIEPIAQTVKPFIEHAQKAINPLVNQAKEEVPKALSKVAEQARGAWEKITSSGQPQIQQQMQQVQQSAQQAGGQVQQAASNAISQAGQAAQQAGEHLVTA